MVMVRTGNNRCTIVIDMTINNHWVEAVVDSGSHASVLRRRFYGSLSCKPRPVESIRLKGASVYWVMVGCGEMVWRWTSEMAMETTT